MIYSSSSRILSILYHYLYLYTGIDRKGCTFKVCCTVSDTIPDTAAMPRCPIPLNCSQRQMHAIVLRRNTLMHWYKQPVLTATLAKNVLYRGEPSLYHRV